MSKKDISRVSRAKEMMERMNASDLTEGLNNYRENVLQASDKPVQNIPVDSLKPAPPDWNFFPPISEGKMLEMMLSIQENGLFNPIIVWETEGSYMILSGHNRVEAFRRIVNEYGNTDGFDEREFRTIPSLIFNEDEIDENKAREIVIDTNYIQREEDKRLMPLIVKNRIDIIKNRKDKKGRTIDVAAKELGLSRTKVYEDYTIGTKIIPEISDLFFDGIIAKKALLKFVNYNEGVQKYLYKNHKDNITTTNCMKIKKNMSRDELSKIFSDDNPEKTIMMQVRVPETLKDEFREMANAWLKERKK